jgi:cell wall-associated NlpC family hydrolase
VTFGERVVEEALSWKGTPFKWGQSQKGLGADCKGFIAGVARELGRPEAEYFYATFANYRSDRPVPSDLLLEGMKATFDRGKKIMPGDVLLLNHRGRPGHLAIATSKGKAVHTQISSKAWVKETTLSALFHFYPLHSIWRWRRSKR